MSLLSIVSKILIFLIRIYQFVISPLSRPCCRFIPTCSQYAIEVITKFGVLIGIILILKRLFKCHPFNIKDIDFSVRKFKNNKK